MASYIIKRSDELYHYGIKGQKWGVRRFENVDGTLTAEGKARYGKNQSYLKPRFPEGKTKYSDLPAKERLKAAWNGQDKEAEAEMLNLMVDVENAVKKSGVIVGYTQIVNTKEYRNWEDEYDKKSYEVHSKYGNEFDKILKDKVRLELEEQRLQGSNDTDKILKHIAEKIELSNRESRYHNKIDDELEPIHEKERKIFDKYYNNAFNAICDQLGIAKKDRDEEIYEIIRKGFIEDWLSNW